MSLNFKLEVSTFKKPILHQSEHKDGIGWRMILKIIVALLALKESMKISDQVLKYLDVFL